LIDLQRGIAGFPKRRKIFLLYGESVVQRRTKPTTARSPMTLTRPGATIVFLKFNGDMGGEFSKRHRKMNSRRSGGGRYRIIGKGC
jgi:hypothetical protein